MKSILSLSDYLSIIDDMRYLYPKDGNWNHPVDNAFLFRGVDDASYGLTPFIFRTTNLKKHGGEVTTYLSQGTEFEILCDFIQESTAYYPSIPENDYFRWAEIAQHFGAPTRFLDWTTNPLVALYFACSKENNKNAAVWILSTSGYELWKERENDIKIINENDVNSVVNKLIKDDPSENDLPYYPFIHSPKFFDPRLAAQSSRFMIWGRNRNSLNQMIKKCHYMRYRNVNNGLRQCDSNSLSKFVCKLIIQNKDKHKLQRELEKVGINQKTLFPGVDGIGKFIEMKYRVNRFEYEMTEF